MMMMMIGLPVFGFWGATVDVGWLRSPPPHSGHNLRQHSTYTRTHFPRRGSAINKTIGSIAHKIPSSIIKCMQYMYVLCKHNTTCSIVYLYKYWDIKHEAYMLGVCPLHITQSHLTQLAVLDEQCLIYNLLRNKCLLIFHHSGDPPPLGLRLDPQESILQGSHCLFLSALYRRGFVDSVHYLGGNWSPRLRWEVACWLSGQHLCLKSLEVEKCSLIAQITLSQSSVQIY